ncbi:DUF1127 domain-containing protein [Lichenihabitans psoromatis]|uniref:DUF1127 domain-containing protein n=1 Tax=Lichenihabitans psoromatis TaxID=2528642 RepID=UPI00103839DB|nr:DUF1127 domain-containing protein [Lichenihabitans psoromatis]
MDETIRSTETRIETVFHAFWSAVGHAMAWPVRVAAARRAMHQLGGMSDCELADIGLSRHDIRDATALGIDGDPTVLLAKRAQERQRFSLASRDARARQAIQRRL